MDESSNISIKNPGPYENKILSAEYVPVSDTITKYLNYLLLWVYVIELGTLSV